MPVPFVPTLCSKKENFGDDYLPFSLPVTLWGDVTLLRLGTSAWKLTLTPKETFHHFFTIEALQRRRHTFTWEAYETLEREIARLTASFNTSQTTALVRFEDEPYPLREGAPTHVRLAAYVHIDYSGCLKPFGI